MIHRSDELKVHRSLLHGRKSELIFALGACLYILPFMRVLVVGNDEGTLISGATRILHGQIFARDFFEVMGPGTFYWLALFFKVFGITFAASRICLFVTSVGTILSMFYLSRRLHKSYAFTPPLLLLATSCWTWPTINHHADSNLVALLSVMSACWWLTVRRSTLLVVAGALAGITTCFLQPKGILLILALLAWAILEYWRGPRARATSAVGSLLGGYVLATGAVILYFACHGALHDLIYANFLWPQKNYGAVNAVPYARGILAYYWEGWNFRSAIGYGIGAILLVPFLTIATIPVLLPIAGMKWPGSFSVPEVRLFWLCGWALWLSEVHRKDIIHLGFGSPLLIILFVYYAGQLPARASRCVFQTLTIATVCLGAYNLLLVLYTHTLKTRVGLVSTFREEKLVEVLEQKTRAGDEIFAYPYCPIYYFLTGTTNPTRYSILMYNYNTPSEFEEALQILRRRRVKYVVWDAHFQDAVNHRFPSAEHVPPASMIIEPYLESHYRQIWSDGNTRLMELKSGAMSAGEGSPSIPASIHLRTAASFHVSQK